MCVIIVFLCCSPNSFAQIRLLQPNGGERLQAGREFVITWTNIDSLALVRLEYSLDAGKSWISITDSAFGYSYLWKPLPNILSDSCLVRISAASPDSTLPVNAGMVRVQIPPPVGGTIFNHPYTEVTNQTVTFSPDGTKILVASWSHFFRNSFGANVNLYGWRQYNMQVLDGVTGNVLYTLPPYRVSNEQTSRFTYGWSSWSGYNWGKNMQSFWHPSSQSLLAQLTDTTFGIIDAGSGAVIRAIQVPRMGNSSRIASMQWVGDGSQILLTVVHRFYNAAISNGSADTLRSFMMRFDAASGTLANTPFQLKELVMADPHCYAWFNWGGGSISHNGERYITFDHFPINCTLRSLTMRSTMDNSVIVGFPLGVVPESLDWWSGTWGGSSNIWSPDDQFVALFALPLSSGYFRASPVATILNAATGQITRQVIFPATTPIINWMWSPDSKKLLLDIMERTSTRRQALDVQTGNFGEHIIPTHLVRFNARTGGGELYGWGNLNNLVPTASSVIWSPNNRYVAGFVAQNPAIINKSNTVGIWNVETGCLVQTFHLPFIEDIGREQQRSFFQNSIQWSADGKRLLLFSPWVYKNAIVQFSSKSTAPYIGNFAVTTLDYDGTALILNVNISDACVHNRDVSDAVWSLMPPNFIRVQDAFFPPLVCEDTTVTLQTTVRNSSSRPFIMKAPRLENNNAGEFALVRSSSIDLATTDTFTLMQGRDDTLTVQFTVRGGGIGLRQAFVHYLDSAGTTLATVTLYAQRDSVNLQPLFPPNSRLHLGRVVQYQTTSAFVTFTNTGTTPFVYDTRASVPSVINLGAYPLLSEGRTFRVDSIVPKVAFPGAVIQYFLTLFQTEAEGQTADSVLVFSCGDVQRRIVLTADIIPLEPRIEIDSLAHFGTLVCSADTLVRVRVSNVGGRVLTVFSAVSSTRDVIVEENAGIFTLEPLESRMIALRFLPSTGGTLEATLTVRSDDRRNPQVTAHLTGEKKSFSYAWFPEQLSFGNVPFGREALLTVPFTNQGTEPLLWNGLPQILSADYTLLSLSPNPLQSGSTATLTVRFAGRRQATTVDELFRIRLNDACQTPILLNMTATILPPQAHIIAPDTVRLPRLYCETEFSTSIVIRNSGDADLRINSIAFQPPLQAAFPNEALHLSSTTIAPLSEAALRVSYRPQQGSERLLQTILLATNDRTASTNGDVRIVLLAEKDSIGAILQTPSRKEHLTTIEEFTALYDTLFVRNTGTTSLHWETEGILNNAQPFPFVIDSTFVLESIEPPVTLPGSASRVVVRFLGGAAGFSVARRVRVSAAAPESPLCRRTLEIALEAEVVKEPRLALMHDVSARVLCENSTNFTIRLASIGTDDIVMQTPEILQNHRNQFRIISAPRRIAARTGQDSIIVQASSLQAGIFTAELHIPSNAANFPNAPTVRITFIKDSSGIQAMPPHLVFPALPVNTAAHSMITLLNTGSVPWAMPLPLIAGAFMLDSVADNPIPAGASTQARVVFAGNAGGITHDTLRLADSCGRVLLIPARVRVVAGEAELPGTLAFQVGDIAEVPVFLRSRRGVEVGAKADFRITIENASLLDVLSPQPDTSRFVALPKGGMAQTLFYRAQISSEQESEPILRLRVRSLLGNTTGTVFVLDNLSIDGVPQSSLARAVYSTQGVNYAGGTPRLIHSSHLKALSFAPNPVTDEIRISLHLLDEAPVVLEAMNNLGQKHRVFSGIIPAGEHILVISASMLPSGAYIFNARIGAEIRSARVSIIR